jgi:hypothetical protein
MKQLKLFVLPSFRIALQAMGEALAISPLMNKALELGDDLHNRCTPLCYVFVMEMLPALVRFVRVLFDL